MHITVQTARTNPSVKKKNIKGIFGIERATKQFRSEARLIRVLSYQGWRLATRVFPEKGADRSPIRSPFPLFSVSAIRNLHSTAPQSRKFEILSPSRFRWPPSRAHVRSACPSGSSSLQIMYRNCEAHLHK